MNAPKNRHSDDRNSHIASLALVMPVLVSACPCDDVRAVGVVVGRSARARSAPSSVLRRAGLERPGVHAEQQHDHARDREPQVLEHRGVAEDRQAEREDRAGSTTATAGGCCAGSCRSRRAGAVVGAAGGQLHQPALLVLGVLAVPEVVAGLRRSGSRRSCTRAAATGSTTRACGASHGSAPAHLAARRACR